MVLSNDGKILRATKSELLKIWNTRDLYEIYSFPEYLSSLQSSGVEILEDKPMSSTDGITMVDIRRDVLRALKDYADRSQDPELIKIAMDIQEVFGDTPEHIVTYLEKSNWSLESSTVVYSEDKGNPDSGGYYLRFGGYEATEVTDFYRPLRPHEAPRDINLSALLDPDMSE